MELKWKFLFAKDARRRPPKVEEWDKGTENQGMTAIFRTKAQNPGMVVWKAVG
jgi:hypothetical protein